MPWMALAVGAGLGLLKSQMVDKPKEERERKLAAATQRYAPWTGLKADPIQMADPMGSMLQYGGAAAGMQQGIQNAGVQTDLAKAQTNWLNHGGSPQYTAAISNTGGMGGSGLGESAYNPWGLYGPKGYSLGMPMKADGTYDMGL